jgi:hypothetical protein
MFSYDLGSLAGSSGRRTDCMADAPMINATQPFACDGGVSDRVMRVV